MPKTYPDAKRENWIEQLAQGGSIKKIAKGSHCDPRTVKRAVQEMRSKNAAQEALVQMYQEALRNHMNGMNAALDTVIEELRLPEPFGAEIPWLEIEPSHLDPKYDFTERERVTKRPGVDDDPFSDRALLVEHLRNSKAWRVLSDWHRNYQEHNVACGRLQIKTLTVLVEKTGIKARLKGDVTSTPFLHAQNMGDLFCRAMIEFLLTQKDTFNLEKESKIIQEGSAIWIRYQKTLLAQDFNNEQQASECLTSIFTALKTLKECTEAQEVAQLFQQLQKNLSKTRNELRAIRLLGVLPGQCRICRQFGL
jgi:hypothetical protein